MRAQRWGTSHSPGGCYGCGWEGVADAVVDLLSPPSFLEEPWFDDLLSFSLVGPGSQCSNSVTVNHCTSMLIFNDCFR